MLSSLEDTAIDGDRAAMSSEVPPSPQVSGHAAWAMAVGGMIGGGIYTLAGVILGLAGPLAWVSLLLGGVLALVTLRSYVCLTLEVGQEGVPVAFLLKKERYRLASVVAWWLLLVYVLAMAVYAFTFAQYVGRALGVSPTTVGLIVVVMIGALMTINFLGIREPSAVQIGAVWIELCLLGVLALVGILRWRPDNLAAGVPAGSLAGVVSGMAATFIAFEGFEMLVYDVHELRSPRAALTRAVPAAVLAVTLMYSLATLGSASLVGAGELVRQKENALAVAGARAAGGTGLVVVTIAACASAASAINATLFSVARLAKSAAESRLVPGFLARTNRRKSPYWAVIMLGAAAAGLAAFSSLEPLVQAASLAFLLLFAFVNGLAFLETRPRSLLALAGAVSAIAAALVVGRTLALSYPRAFGGFAIISIASIFANALMESRRRARGEPPPPQDPAVQRKRATVVRGLLGLGRGPGGRATSQ